MAGDDLSQYEAKGDDELSKYAVQTKPDLKTGAGMEHPQAPTLPVNPYHDVLNPIDPIEALQDKVYGTKQEGQLHAAPLPFPVSAAAPPIEMAKGALRGAAGGYAATKAGDALHLGPWGKAALGVVGAGLGIKSPEIAEGLANRVVGEENVPMWMKSPQSVGRMVDTARNDMYNDLGDRAMARPDEPAIIKGPSQTLRSSPNFDSAAGQAYKAGRGSRIAAPESEGGTIASPAEYGRGGESQIGSNAVERQVQTIMQKNIVTPEEQSFVERSLGPNARMRPGEGITDWRARVTGLMKAARARTK